MPKEIIELTILVYRYSFLLLEQLDTMYIAATSRLGFKGTRSKLSTSAKLAVGFVHPLDRHRGAVAGGACTAATSVVTSRPIGSRHAHRCLVGFPLRWAGRCMSGVCSWVNFTV